MSYINPAQLWIQTAAPQPTVYEAESPSQTNSPDTCGPPTPIGSTSSQYHIPCPNVTYQPPSGGINGAYIANTDGGLAYGYPQYPIGGYVQMVDPYTYMVLPTGQPVPVFPSTAPSVVLVPQPHSQPTYAIQPSTYVTQVPTAMGAVNAPYAPVSGAIPSLATTTDFSSMLPQSPALYAPVPQACHSAVLSWQPSGEHYASDGGFGYRPPSSQRSVVPSIEATTETLPAQPAQAESIVTYPDAAPVNRETVVDGTLATSQLPKTPVLDVDCPFYVPPGTSPIKQTPARCHGQSSVSGDQATVPDTSPPTPTEAVRTGQKRLREDDEDGADDVLTELREVRNIRPGDIKIVRARRQEMVEMLGFTPSEPGSMSVVERKRNYVECMEHYVTFLHDQLRMVGQTPMAVDKLNKYDGINSRSVRTMIVCMQEKARKLHKKVLNEERSFLDMKSRLSAMESKELRSSKRQRTDNP